MGEYSIFWCKEKEEKSLKSIGVNMRHLAFYDNYGLKGSLAKYGKIVQQYK